MQGVKFRTQGLGLGFGVGVWGLGFGGWGLGFGACGLGSGVWGSSPSREEESIFIELMIPGRGRNALRRLPRTSTTLCLLHESPRVDYLW